jgi:hypothetical protein
MNILGHWDKAFFGADRSRLLEWYLSSGYPALWLGQLSSPRGFVLCRPGSNAHQIGPLSAVDYRSARRLFSRVLDELPNGPLIADIIVPNEEAISLMETFGFERFRILQRMYRGENDSPGHVQNIFCMAGFEFG